MLKIFLVVFTATFSIAGVPSGRRDALTPFLGKRYKAEGVQGGDEKLVLTQKGRELTLTFTKYKPGKTEVIETQIQNSKPRFNLFRNILGYREGNKIFIDFTVKHRKYRSSKYQSTMEYITRSDGGTEMKVEIIETTTTVFISHDKSPPSQIATFFIEMASSRGQ